MAVEMDSAVNSFIELTQWKGPRRDAQAYLEAAGGDLNTAVVLFFDTGGAGEPVSTQQPRPASAPQAPSRSLMEELNDEYKHDLVKHAAPRANPAIAIVSLAFPRPLCYLFSILNSLAGVLSLFVPQGILQKLTVGGTEVARRVTPFDKVLSSIPESSPARAVESSKLLRGITYNAALEHVKSKLAYLVVVLVSEVHETPVSPFVRQVLETRAAARDNVFFWFGSALTAEGLNVATAYDAPALPFVAFVSPSPKSAQSNIIVMENLFQLAGEGLLDTSLKRDQFDELVGTAIENHEPRLLSLRLDRERFDVDRKIRQEQTEAYERSLKRDQKRAEEAKAEEARRKLERKRHQVWLSGVFERASAITGKAPAPTNARVCVKLPDGKRHNLAVPGDAPVKAIYDVTYALLNPDEHAAVSVSEVVGDSQELLKDFEPPYGFALVSTVLRKELPIDDTIVRNIDAVWPSGVLIVDLE